MWLTRAFSPRRLSMGRLSKTYGLRVNEVEKIVHDHVLIHNMMIFTNILHLKMFTLVSIAQSMWDDAFKVFSLKWFT